MVGSKIAMSRLLQYFLSIFLGAIEIKKRIYWPNGRFPLAQNTYKHTNAHIRARRANPQQSIMIIIIAVAASTNKYSIKTTSTTTKTDKKNKKKKILSAVAKAIWQSPPVCIRTCNIHHHTQESFLWPLYSVRDSATYRTDRTTGKRRQAQKKNCNWRKVIKHKHNKIFYSGLAESKRREKRHNHKSAQYKELCAYALHIKLLHNT